MSNIIMVQALYNFLDIFWCSWAFTLNILQQKRWNLDENHALPLNFITNHLRSEKVKAKHIWPNSRIPSDFISTDQYYLMKFNDRSELKACFFIEIHEKKALFCSEIKCTFAATKQACFQMTRDIWTKDRREMWTKFDVSFNRLHITGRQLIRFHQF